MYPGASAKKRTEVMELTGTIGFLGYGNMGSAILEGLIARTVIRPKQALAYDPVAERCAAAERLGAGVAASPTALAAASDMLILAVKPQTMDSAISGLGAALKPSCLVISIAAGISIAKLQQWLGAGVRVIRVMPNTPALVQTGAAGIAPSANCTPADLDIARTIFESIGIAEVVSEKDIDAVTALSGSGPAYFFYMVECLVDAAVAEGMDRNAATRLAGQTLLGAGLLLQSSPDSAATLRQKVTSKGGTTEAALKKFAELNFAGVIAAGVQAAAERSRELGA
jgi:pyrroline-5-carboxylate reductase